MTRSLWILCLLVPMIAAAGPQCDNPQIGETTPNSAFEHDNVAGTVTHKRTGLMWTRCRLGQDPAPEALCAGTPTTLPWNLALQEAANSTNAGYDDWRLPTRAELATIVEHCRANPALNTVFFPLVSHFQHSVWTSTPFSGEAGRAWIVFFGTGEATPIPHTDGANVRLVRTAEKPYAVGQIGPAGGIVFYDKGYREHGWRYLEAAPKNWNAGKHDPWTTWGCSGTLVGATAEEIGAGAANTTLLVDAGCTAALIAADAEINGYDDWFLPSLKELGAMHKVLARRANFHYTYGFQTMSYASSTELDATGGLTIDFAGGGSVVQVSKSLATIVVRPVRAF